jgi:hypothetical protein
MRTPLLSICLPPSDSDEPEDEGAVISRSACRFSADPIICTTAPSAIGSGNTQEPVPTARVTGRRPVQLAQPRETDTHVLPAGMTFLSFRGIMDADRQVTVWLEDPIFSRTCTAYAPAVRRRRERRQRGIAGLDQRSARRPHRIRQPLRTARTSMVRSRVALILRASPGLAREQCRRAGAQRGCASRFAGPDNLPRAGQRRTA